MALGNIRSRHIPTSGPSQCRNTGTASSMITRKHLFTHTHNKGKNSNSNSGRKAKPASIDLAKQQLVSLIILFTATLNAGFTAYL